MQKQLLREWIGLEYNKSLLQESREKNGGKLILQGIIQKADTKNQNKRIYPSAILKREIENHLKAVRENRAVGELDHPDCMQADGLFILSRHNWLPASEVNENTEVATLNLQTNRIEYQKIKRNIYENYSGDMIRIYNNKGTLDQLVTPNHRVLLWDRDGVPYYEYAIDLHNKNQQRDSRLSHSSVRRTAVWEGNDIDFVTLPGTNIEVSSENWCAFLGIWLAEGWADGVKSQYGKSFGVHIKQKAGTERNKQIEDLLLSMNIEFSKSSDGTCFSMNFGKEFHKYFYDLGNSCNKRIPNDVKDYSPRLLSVLIEWMLKGDGRNRIGYKKINDEFAPIVKEYATTSVKLANDVQEVMFKLGYGATIHTYLQKDRMIEEDRMILAENSKPMNIVYGHVSRSISMDNRFLKTEVVKFNGNIFCVTTDNGNWFARTASGNTFWTGNSSTVSLDRVSHIVRDMWWNGNDVMGRIEILNTPKGKILESLLEAEVAIGISSRGVGSTQKSNEGYDTVQSDYQIICFDIVSEPSTPGAYLFAESKHIDIETKISKADRIFRALNDIVMR